MWRVAELREKARDAVEYLRVVPDAVPVGMRRLVVFPMAETMIVTWKPTFRFSMTRRTALIIVGTPLTDVPPNFMTTLP